MIKETLKLLRTIEKKIKIKCFVAIYLSDEGLKISVSVNIKERSFVLGRIISEDELLEDYWGLEEYWECIIDEFCSDFNKRIKY